MKMWIARNAEGWLYLHDMEPVLVGSDWESLRDRYIIDSRIFPEVTFENSPMEVELKLIESCKVLL